MESYDYVKAGYLTPESGRRLPLQDQEIAPLTITNRVPALLKIVPRDRGMLKNTLCFYYPL